MSDKKLEVSELANAFLEEKIDDSKVVMVARPELIVDKIMDVQGQINARIAGIKRSIPKPAECIDCPDERRKQSKTYKRKRKQCNKHELETNKQGAHIFETCDVYKKLLEYTSEFGTNQMQNDPHPKRLKSIASNYFSDFPIVHTRKSKYEFFKPGYIDHDIKIKLLTTCHDCKPKTYTYTAQRQFCNSHSVDITGSGWIQSVSFNQCNSFDKARKKLKSVPDGNVTPETMIKLAKEQHEREVQERIPQIERLEQMIVYYDELIMKVLAKALEA
jgi:hypothetical protein